MSVANIAMSLAPMHEARACEGVALLPTDSNHESRTTELGCP